MRKAFITGASGGVGLEVARQLSDAGWQVIAHYRTQPREIDGVTWWQADLCAEYELPEIHELDALVHCAGVATLGRVSEAPQQDWLTAMAVNLHAPVAVTNALLPALRAAHGHVVYLNSGAGHRANPNWGAYAASKFAARAWCDALRAEEPVIRVTSVHPGRIDTPMQKHIVEQEQGDYDPAQYLRASTVAAAVVYALNTPDDCEPNEMILRPRTH
ncbi:SDR family oxidoreductase [Corynebacterium canis]|uniref:SDR family oxidoreductase n=1 Tax=Corynebacterium canis TaxID=679663 RepID=A0A5C5U906_9CORY|nr:SDR family oxidoreductase [Corynebacterium canis]TWT22881.1 SDR family oxidoreductase [Corynebacterium canis]WJY76506.1 putative oxidoreductase [Corynebacterium canis]